MNEELNEVRENPDEFNKYYNYVEEKVEELMEFLKENFKNIDVIEK